MKNLNDVLVEQLKDLYSAETQLVSALPVVVKNIVNEELKESVSEHLKETKIQVKRLEEIGKMLNIKLNGHTCQAMKGLIKECEEVLKENYSDISLKDVLIVSCAQRVEHYEIAGYGNAIALANFLNLRGVESLLRDTIEEEGDADKKLTEICMDTLFDTCVPAEKDFVETRSSL